MRPQAQPSTTQEITVLSSAENLTALCRLIFRRHSENESGDSIYQFIGELIVLPKAICFIAVF